MRFSVHSFEIKRNHDRKGIYDAQFWEDVERTAKGLPEACGCYMFSISHGNRTTPWYVGMTEANSFRNEVFNQRNKKRFNQVLKTRNGTPRIFLLPAMTSTSRYIRPSIIGHNSIRYLEFVLIVMAVRQNSDILNTKYAQTLRNMRVPGVINLGPGQPDEEASRLRNSLGLN